MAIDTKKKLNRAVEAEFRHLMGKDPNGLLIPEQIVEAAESITNPLHKYFTWDDTKAAEKWRLHEARKLVKSFTIYNEELKVEVRALTSLDIDREGKGGYRWTMEVVKRPDLREQMLETALRELKIVQLRYSHLSELSSVWASIDRVNDEGYGSKVS